MKKHEHLKIPNKFDVEPSQFWYELSVKSILTIFFAQSICTKIFIFQKTFYSTIIRMSENSISLVNFSSFPWFSKFQKFEFERRSERYVSGLFYFEKVFGLNNDNKKTKVKI